MVLMNAFLFFVIVATDEVPDPADQGPVGVEPSQRTALLPQHVLRLDDMLERRVGPGAVLAATTVTCALRSLVVGDRVSRLGARGHFHRDRALGGGRGASGCPLGTIDQAVWLLS